MAAMLSCWTGSKFDRNDTTGMWAGAIAGLNPEQIKHGIRELSTLNTAWPPAPGQFRAMCMTYRRPEEPAARQLTDDSPARFAEREQIRIAAGELARSLRAVIPPPRPPIHNVRSRIEQALCVHEWHRHQYLAGDFCGKCDLLEIEKLDAFEARHHSETPLR